MATIDLDAIRWDRRLLRDGLAPGAGCAAVLKADADGLGGTGGARAEFERTVPGLVPMRSPPRKDLADAIGSIGYEVLTSLGCRFRRIYQGGMEPVRYQSAGELQT